MSKKIKNLLLIAFLSIPLLCSCSIGCNHEDSSWFIDKEPTCIDAGHRYYTCNICGERLYGEKIDALGHVPGEWIIDKEPTCTEDGHKYQSCVECGSIFVESNIEKLGHSYICVGEVQSFDNQPTMEKYVCSRCGDVCYIEYYSKFLKYQKRYNGVTITGIGNCQDVDIVIPKFIDGVPVVEIGHDAFNHCEKIKSVFIPDSVTSIGNSAFYGCSSLSTITIPDGVTSIGDSAFNLCLSLSSITIPDSVTSIGDYAFLGCKSLSSITIPDGVTSIGDGAFERCYGLKLIIYRGKEYNSVNDFLEDFYNLLNP